MREWMDSFSGGIFGKRTRRDGVVRATRRKLVFLHVTQANGSICIYLKHAVCRNRCPCPLMSACHEKTGGELPLLRSSALQDSALPTTSLAQVCLLSMGRCQRLTLRVMFPVRFAGNRFISSTSLLHFPIFFRSLTGRKGRKEPTVPQNSNRRQPQP